MKQIATKFFDFCFLDFLQIEETGGVWQTLPHTHKPCQKDTRVTSLNSLDNNCLNVVSFASYRFLYKRRFKEHWYGVKTNQSNKSIFRFVS